MRSRKWMLRRSRIPTSTTAIGLLNPKSTPKIVSSSASAAGQGLPKAATYYADPADPGLIRELVKAGYNAFPALKDQGSVYAGIMLLKSLNITVDPLSLNIIAENESYCWKETRDEVTLDEPVKEYDHALDAARYALYTHLKWDADLKVECF